jgi:hypothetical protein
MQAARRRAVFDFPRRLGRRTEAGPRQVLPRVRRRRASAVLHTLRRISGHYLRVGFPLVG